MNKMHCCLALCLLAFAHSQAFAAAGNTPITCRTVAPTAADPDTVRLDISKSDRGPDSYDAHLQIHNSSQYPDLDTWIHVFGLAEEFGHKSSGGSQISSGEEHIMFSSSAENLAHLGQENLDQPTFWLEIKFEGLDSMPATFDGKDSASWRQFNHLQYTIAPTTEAIKPQFFYVDDSGPDFTCVRN